MSEQITLMNNHSGRLHHYFGMSSNLWTENMHFKAFVHNQRNINVKLVIAFFYILLHFFLLNEGYCVWGARGRLQGPLWGYGWSWHGCWPLTLLTSVWFFNHFYVKIFLNKFALEDNNSVTSSFSEFNCSIEMLINTELNLKISFVFCPAISC